MNKTMFNSPFGCLINSVRILLSLFLSIYSQESVLKISVIIPCYYGHFNHLEELLKCYSIQTVLPDEVVISISEIKKVAAGELLAIKSRKYPFSVKIIEHENKLLAGPNSNSACENAAGDVFICNDADDLPHPQHVKIIKYYFEHYDIDEIIHNLILGYLFAHRCSVIPLTANSYFGKYEKENIKWYPLTSYDQLDNFPYHHNGNVAIRRKVFERIKWHDVSEYRR